MTVYGCAAERLNFVIYCDTLLLFCAGRATPAGTSGSVSSELRQGESGGTHGARLACLPLRFERCDVDVAERFAVPIENAIGGCQHEPRQAQQQRGETAHGICEKSRSYASSMAREIASSCGSAKAGGSCKSCPVQNKASVIVGQPGWDRARKERDRAHLDHRAAVLVPGAERRVGESVGRRRHNVGRC